MADIIEEGSTEFKITFRQLSCMEVIKRTALKIAKGYEGNVKIEINIAKGTGEVKCNITEYDI